MASSRLVMKLETLQDVRLHGRIEPAGKMVEIDDGLARRWVELGLAKPYVEPRKPASKSEVKPEPAGKSEAEPAAEEKKASRFGKRRK